MTAQDSRLLEDLLDEFVRRHLAGELPDPVAYAQRAGEEAPRLRELIAVFLSESPPVPPKPEAARELARRYRADRELAAADAAEREPSWRQSLQKVLSGWLSAVPSRRAELLDGIAGSASMLSLEPAAARNRASAASRSSVTLIQLNHPAGARAEVHDDGLLTLTVFGLPTEFVGSRPLVAFPKAQPPDGLDLDWCGRARGLPDGIAQAEEVREQRELRVTVGRLGAERRQLDSLLSEVRVIGIPSEDL